MAISFIDILLDVEFAPMARGFPTYENVAIKTLLGRTHPAVGRYDYISKYSISYGKCGKELFDHLRTFFILRQCGAQGFRFLAPDKNTATGEVIGNIASGTTTYGLIQTYQDIGNTYVRRIVKPYPEVILYVNDVPVPFTTTDIGLGGLPLYGEGMYGSGEGSDVILLNYNTGVVTLPEDFATAHAGESLKWDGTFHIPVMFVGNPDAGHETTYSDIDEFNLEEILPSSLGIE